MHLSAKNAKKPQHHQVSNSLLAEKAQFPWPLMHSVPGNTTVLSVSIFFLTTLQQLKEHSKVLDLITDTEPSLLSLQLYWDNKGLFLLKMFALFIVFNFNLRKLSFAKYIFL